MTAKQVSLTYGTIILVLCLVLTACALSNQGASGGTVPDRDTSDSGQDWLGPEEPTPTIHAGKVGSGYVDISSKYLGYGSELEAVASVPIEIYQDKQGKLQIIGTNAGNARLQIKGSNNCECNGMYRISSEINGTILTSGLDCIIVFSETRTWLSGDCNCSCADQSISCDDVLPDIEDFGPFEVSYAEAIYAESGAKAEAIFDYQWTFKDLKLNTSDNCFNAEVINKDSDN